MTTQIIADIKGFKQCINQLSNEIDQVNEKLSIKLNDISRTERLSRLRETVIHIENITTLGTTLTDILYDIQTQEKIDKILIEKVGKILARILYMANHGTLRSAFKSLRIIKKRLDAIKPEIEAIKAK